MKIEGVWEREKMKIVTASNCFGEIKGKLGVELFCV